VFFVLKTVVLCKLAFKMNKENKQVDSIFKEEEAFELYKAGGQPSIRRAKNTLLVIGALMLLVPIIAVLRSDESPDLYAIVYVVFTSCLFIGFRYMGPIAQGLIRQ